MLVAVMALVKELDGDGLIAVQAEVSERMRGGVEMAGEGLKLAVGGRSWEDTEQIEVVSLRARRDAREDGSGERGDRASEQAVDRRRKSSKEDGVAACLARC